MEEKTRAETEKGHEMRTEVEIAEEGYQRHTFKTGIDAAKILINGVNSSSPKEIAKGMYAELIHSHRTLQASFFRTLLLLCNNYKEAGFDLRNEAAVEAAKKISELDLHIPFI